MLRFILNLPTPLLYTCDQTHNNERNRSKFQANQHRQSLHSEFPCNGQLGRYPCFSTTGQTTRRKNATVEMDRPIIYPERMLQ